MSFRYLFAFGFLLAHITFFILVCYQPLLRLLSAQFSSLVIPVWAIPTPNLLRYAGLVPLSFCLFEYLWPVIHRGNDHHTQAKSVKRSQPSKGNKRRPLAFLGYHSNDGFRSLFRSQSILGQNSKRKNSKASAEPLYLRTQRGSTSHDLMPRFFVYRDDGSRVPMIALDELPAQLKLGRENWNRQSWTAFMTPVSEEQFPKEGEYEVSFSIRTRFQRDKATFISDDISDCSEIPS